MISLLIKFKIPTAAHFSKTVSQIYCWKLTCYMIAAINKHDISHSFLKQTSLSKIAIQITFELNEKYFNSYRFYRGF